MRYWTALLLLPLLFLLPGLANDEGAAGQPPPNCGDYTLDGKVDIQDILSFVVPVRRLDASPGHPNFDSRWDRLSGPGVFLRWVNIQDLLDLLYPNRAIPRDCPDSVPFLSKLTDLDAQFSANPAGTAVMMNASYEAVMTFDCTICRTLGNAFTAGPAYVYQDPTKILPSCEGEQPGTDCSDILLTTTGQRCWQRFFNGSRYIADITQGDVQNEIVAKAIALEAEPAFDGLYIDVAEAHLPHAADCPGAPSVSNAAWLGAWATLAERLQAEVAGPLILNAQYTLWDDIRATSEPNALRLWAAPDVIEIEFGWVFGRHGEATPSGASDKLAYIDLLHSLGTAVFTQDYEDGNGDMTPAQEAFGLAMFFITREQGDYYGTFSHDGHGSAFGWGQVLGDALSTRYTCGVGCYARDFEKGTVTADVTTKTGGLP